VTQTYNPGIIIKTNKQKTIKAKLKLCDKDLEGFSAAAYRSSFNNNNNNNNNK